MALNRQTRFPAAAREEKPPLKMGRPGPTAIRPTVSRETAEIAVHLRENPVFVDLMDGLKRSALARFENSEMGPGGATEREAARYELEALSAIESRLGAVAAEIHLHSPADDLSGD
jgi:hypothetical protein